MGLYRTGRDGAGLRGGIFRVGCAGMRGEHEDLGCDRSIACRGRAEYCGFRIRMSGPFSPVCSTEPVG